MVHAVTLAVVLLVGADLAGLIPMSVLAADNLAPNVDTALIRGGINSFVNGVGFNVRRRRTARICTP